MVGSVSLAMSISETVFLWLLLECNEAACTDWRVDEAADDARGRFKVSNNFSFVDCRWCTSSLRRRFCAHSGFAAPSADEDSRENFELC